MGVLKMRYFAMARCRRKGILAARNIERRRKEGEVEYDWEEREARWFMKVGGDEEEDGVE